VFILVKGFQEKQKLAFQCRNLLYCIILFLISSLCIPKKGWYTMFVGALFKWWTLMVTPESGSFPKGKKPKNLLPSVSLMNWHYATSNLLSSLPTTSFVKILFFRSSLSFLCLSVFSPSHGPLKPLKFMSVGSKPLWKSCVDSSFSICKSSKNSF